jgi:V/A-type H+-transporting ATPase subunit I
MKRIELTILDRDVDKVIEFLGRRGLLHVAGDGDVEPQTRDVEAHRRIDETLERIKTLASYLEIDLPAEPSVDAGLPGEADAALMEKMASGIAVLRGREQEIKEERRRVEATLNEAQAFENLNAPFNDLDQLSYLTLRIGRVDLKKQEDLQASLGDRAVIIPLAAQEGDSGGRILAAASRKGRFALDSELKKQDFVPTVVPEGYKGIPAEMITGLKSRITELDGELERVGAGKAQFRGEWGQTIALLTSNFLVADQVERFKETLRATASVYVISGWAPADEVTDLVARIEELTGGRAAIRAYTPEELSSVASGAERVPVSLQHGAFVRGFEKLVFSYGAPLYGTIDPTPFVAAFFIILFGIMFGDLGQGLVLLLLGLLTGKKGPRALAGARVYSTPLIAVGISSMVMGLLTGEVFAVEGLLAVPTELVTGFFMGLFGIPGEPPHQILHLMPETGSIAKLFYFFGFTISVGVVLNSIGLIVNITNLCILKKYEKAFFSKTGLAGLLLFWYALFIAVRILLGGRFAWFDLVGLILPALFIFFGPLFWRLVSGERPLLEAGLLVFFMEGFVEVLETASTYISNTVSFLRVGAFALSHAVLSFIVFTLSEMVAKAPVGPAFSILIMIFGNAVIIVLEGMIVAIQVVRLQYYEFFSKFFTETGMAFSPFRFRKGEET